MAALAAVGVVAASRLWPADDPLLSATPLDGRGRHTHVFVIDAQHPIWPRTG
jgi:hypothetical protein